jgi:hypothetical protein
MTARCAAALVACTIVGLILPLSGCSDGESPTSPTDTTPTETAVDPSTSLTFSGTLAVRSSAFYSFDVTAYGTVNVTLQNVGGVTGVPDTVWVGLGIGVPEGTDCSTTTSLNTQAGGGPHVSTVLAAGTYCARIYDVGNLAAPTAFTVLIAHP